MLIAAVIAVCIIVLILAFLAPRLSRGPQQEASRAFGVGARGTSHAPGPLGRWLPKPFRTSQKAVNKSGAAGRKGRSKMPF
jgi:hypothetical protein